MAILVTGGAGYIGSVTVERLTAKGESVVVLDDLVYGHRESIDAGIPFYQGSAGDRGLLARITKEHKIESCVHFAALAYVGESVEKPALYFETNVQQGISLVSALMDAGVRRFIFSSSCTVYGEQEKSPIGEDFPQWPKNLYGWTKFTLERLLEAYDTAYGLKSICLRYFNAVGATERCGEDHCLRGLLVAGQKRGTTSRLRASGTRGATFSAKPTLIRRSHSNPTLLAV